MLNWKQDPDAVLLSMAEIEGDHWLERQEWLSDNRDMNGWYYSFYYAIEHLSDDYDGFGPDVACVYGDGGFNRYFLGADGSVRLSKMHMWRRGDEEIARGLGIVVA
jgi:hypothetical protein